MRGTPNDKEAVAAGAINLPKLQPASWAPSQFHAKWRSTGPTGPGSPLLPPDLRGDVLFVSFFSFSLSFLSTFLSSFADVPLTVVPRWLWLAVVGLQLLLQEVLVGRVDLVGSVQEGGCLGAEQLEPG